MKSLLTILLFLLASPVLAEQPATPVAYLAVADGYWQVWGMAEDGSHQRQITRSPYDKNRVSWYPDGRSLLINGNQGELYRVDIETGSEIAIKTTLNGMNDAVISPDGTRIAFSLSTSGSIDDNNIWLVDADGQNEIKLTNEKGLQHQPVWSVDGKFLYFLSGSGGQTHDIWRISMDGRDMEQLTSTSLYHFDVAVAGNGRLAFSANRSGNYEIWLRDPAGSFTRLTGNPANDGKPAWSPDGKWLLFESSRSGIPEIWKMDADGGDQIQLTRDPQGARVPVWYRPSGETS